MSNFSIFCPSGQKNSLRVRSESTWVRGGLASYLLRVKSKLGSVQGPSLILNHQYLNVIFCTLLIREKNPIFPSKLSTYWVFKSPRQRSTHQALRIVLNLDTHQSLWSVSTFVKLTKMSFVKFYTKLKML